MERLLVAVRVCGTARSSLSSQYLKDLYACPDVTRSRFFPFSRPPVQLHATRGKIKKYVRKFLAPFATPELAYPQRRVKSQSKD